MLKLGLQLTTWHNYMNAKLTYSNQVWVKTKVPGVWRYVFTYPDKWSSRQVVKSFYNGERSK